MLTIERDNPIDLLKKYIDIFSVLHVPEDKWLTAREKQYLVANIILNAKGIDLASSTAASILENNWGFINRGVSMYRLKLKQKGWLVQTSNGIELLKAFNFKGTIPVEMSFNFKVVYNGQKSREHSESGSKSKPSKTIDTEVSG